MDESLKVIACLLNVIDAAIKSGDWKVDGTCDPDLDIGRAKSILWRNGWSQNLADEQWIKR